jgi:gliding motility-associated-like protein
VSVSAITNENDASFQWWYDNEDNIIEGQTGSSLDIPRDSQDHFIPGTYGVTITVGGCTGSDSIDVSLYDNADCVISQGLSPSNGDGLNDRLDLSFLDDRSGIASIQIFNRLGTVVYDRTSYRKEWKGQSNANKILPSGTYYYIINLKNEDPVFGNEASGWVYLNREEN